MDPGLRQPIRPSVVAFFSLELQGISYDFMDFGVPVQPPWNYIIQITLIYKFGFGRFGFGRLLRIPPAIVLCDDQYPIPRS
jgi:hypothetical protein